MCQKCAKELPIFAQRCIVCDKEKPRGTTCKWHGKGAILDGVISAGGYGWPHIQRGVQWLKFRGIRNVAPILAGLIEPYLPLIAPLPHLQNQAIFVPIPLHRRRLSERGFNQSLEIAQILSEYTNIPVADVLARKKSTWSQAELPHELRQENIEEAFELKQELPDVSCFLLLDDVTTTGSTLSSAAAVLKDARAPEVWGLTVARG